MSLLERLDTNISPNCSAILKQFSNVDGMFRGAQFSQVPSDFLDPKSTSKESRDGSQINFESSRLVSCAIEITYDA